MGSYRGRRADSDKAEVSERAALPGESVVRSGSDSLDTQASGLSMFSDAAGGACGRGATLVHYQKAKREKHSLRLHFGPSGAASVHEGTGTGKGDRTSDMPKAVSIAYRLGDSLPSRYWKLSRVWVGVGLLATILPLANLYLMVFKPG